MAGVVFQLASQEHFQERRLSKPFDLQKQKPLDYHAIRALPLRND
jgi:hypothetical protein